MPSPQRSEQVLLVGSASFLLFSPLGLFLSLSEQTVHRAGPWEGLGCALSSRAGLCLCEPDLQGTRMTFQLERDEK